MYWRERLNGCIFTTDGLTTVSKLNFKVQEPLLFKKQSFYTQLWYLAISVSFSDILHLTLT